MKRTVVHREAGTADVTNPEQRYVVVVLEPHGGYTVEVRRAGPKAAAEQAQPVIRSHFGAYAEASAISEARGLGAGMRADERWYATAAWRHV